MRGFGRRKTFQNVVRVIDFKVFRFFEKIEKSMPKWLPKSIVDAERHRRTPQDLRRIESKRVQCETLSRS